MTARVNLPYFDVFVSQYESAETKRAYTRDVYRFFSNINKEPVNVTKADVISYIQILKSLNLVSRSIARSMYAVRSYMKFLVNMDIIVKNPVDGVRIPKMYSSPEMGITNEELIKMINSFSRKEYKNSKLDYAVFCLMLYNGLRRSEVCSINYGDIRNDNGISVIEIRGKGNKTRVRPIHPVCQKAIVEYLKKEKRISGNPEDPIFAINGERINTYHVYTIIRRISRNSKLERLIHPHMLRAKFASLALESGQPITSVQADMGHSNIDTTAIYDKAKHSLERSAVLGIKEIVLPGPKRGKRKE